MYLVKEAKRRWKNLRDTFRDVKKRRKPKTGGAGGSRAMKEWAFFEQMSFLDDRASNQETDSSIPPFVTNDDDDDDLESET